MGLSVTVNGDKQVMQVLTDLRGRMRDLTPAMRSIGILVKSAAQGNFKDQKSPDGTPWAALSAVTQARRRKGKGGGRNQILRDTGVLANSVQIQSAAAHSVVVGSRIAYATTHQYGARQGAFGRGNYRSRKGSFAIPWGDIPARPYLGINDTMRGDIVDLIQSHIARGSK